MRSIMIINTSFSKKKKEIKTKLLIIVITNIDQEKQDSALNKAGR